MEPGMVGVVNSPIYNKIKNFIFIFSNFKKILKLDFLKNKKF